MLKSEIEAVNSLTSDLQNNSQYFQQDASGTMDFTAQFSADNATSEDSFDWTSMLNFDNRNNGQYSQENAPGTIDFTEQFSAGNATPEDSFNWTSVLDFDCY